jgi:hypothetical protein
MLLSLDFPRDGEVLEPSGIQARPELDPRQKHSGVTPWDKFSSLCSDTPTACYGVVQSSILHHPFSSPHLITLSALASTFGGIVRPICFAAFRLIISSNFIGCSTGKSAGLAPFRILSTYVAARRSKSLKFTP